ncbi:hypothetical protein [Flexivirga alba]|uniref:DUF2306 domain-containing protein n=1 Tax=Flexivirga alba TaxID=702742 RepID=A0ABW2ADX2_9MICO
MLVHSILGGGIMLLGPWQLFTGSTRRMMRGHKVIGRTYAVIVAASMIAAAIYVVRTPWTDVFSGPVFAVGLWGFWVGVVVSLTLGIMAIRLGWSLVLGFDHFSASGPSARRSVPARSIAARSCRGCARSGSPRAR